MWNYESRKVARHNWKVGKADAFISTASVNDSRFPVETAVCHPEYNGGEIVIVEGYDTKQEAIAGHQRWVELMTAKKLPDSLQDIAASGVGELHAAFGGETVFKRQIKH